MDTLLDRAYNVKRLEILQRTSDAAAELWTNRTWTDREEFRARVVPLVNGAITATVTLVGAYLSATAELAGEKKAVAMPSFDVEALRGVPADVVYDRPWGTLGAALAAGRDFVDADEEARAYVERLVSVDLQLAQQRSTIAWFEAHNAD